MASIWWTCVILVGSAYTILAANIPASAEDNRILIVTDQNQFRLLFNAPVNGVTNGVNVQTTADTRSLLTFLGGTLVSLAALLFGVGTTTTTGTSGTGIATISSPANGLIITGYPAYGNVAALNGGLNVIKPTYVGTVSSPGLVGTSAGLGAGLGSNVNLGGSSGGTSGLGLGVGSGVNLGGSSSGTSGHGLGVGSGVNLGGSSGGTSGLGLGVGSGVNLGGSSGGTSGLGLGVGSGVNLGGSSGGTSGLGLGVGSGVNLGGSSGGTSGHGLGVGSGVNLGGSSVGGSGGSSVVGSGGSSVGASPVGVSLPLPVSFGNGITTSININGIPVASVGPLVSTSSSGTQIGASTPVIVSASISSKSDKHNSQNDVIHPYGKVTYFIPDGNNHGQKSQRPAIVHTIQANKIANGTETVTYEGVQYLKKKK